MNRNNSAILGLGVCATVCAAGAALPVLLGVSAGGLILSAGGSTVNVVLITAVGIAMAGVCVWKKSRKTAAATCKADEPCGRVEQQLAVRKDD